LCGKTDTKIDFLIADKLNYLLSLREKRLEKCIVFLIQGTDTASLGETRGKKFSEDRWRVHTARMPQEKPMT